MCPLCFHLLSIFSFSFKKNGTKEKYSQDICDAPVAQCFRFPSSSTSISKGNSRHLSSDVATCTVRFNWQQLYASHGKCSYVSTFSKNNVCINIYGRCLDWNLSIWYLRVQLGAGTQSFLVRVSVCVSLIFPGWPTSHVQHIKQTFILLQKC